MSTFVSEQRVIATKQITEDGSSLRNCTKFKSEFVHANKGDKGTVEFVAEDGVVYVHFDGGTSVNVIPEDIEPITVDTPPRRRKPKKMSKLFRDRQNIQRMKLEAVIIAAETKLDSAKKDLELFDIDCRTNGLFTEITEKIREVCVEYEMAFLPTISNIKDGLDIINPPDEVEDDDDDDDDFCGSV